MEFSIRRQSFLERLVLASRAIAAHSPMPLLEGVRIQVFSDRMVLTGSDKEFTVQTTIYPDEQNLFVIEQPGSIVVDSRYLLELIRRISGETIKIFTVDGDLMRVSSKDGSFDLIGRPSADYPALALDQPETHFQLPARLLQEIYDQISYAVSEKDSRQVLLGINLQIENQTLAATATDSYRLARKVCPVETGVECRITIPTQPFGEACRSFGSHEMIDLYVDRRKIQFVFGDTLMQSQLYEGVFPDASRIIPDRFVASLTLPASDLEAMLARTAIYTASTSQAGSIAPVQMTCSPEQVNLRVLSSEIGSCKQSLEAPVYEGSDITVSFNARLMQDALKGLHSSVRVTLGFTGELRPIRISNPDDETLTMIVVPIRSN